MLRSCGEPCEAFSDGGVETVLPLFPPDFVWYATDRWLEGSAYRSGRPRARAASPPITT